MDGGSPVTDAKEDIMIDIGSEFSPYPSGRFPKDGQFNGERFRLEHLAPALEKAIQAGSKVVVNIDGVRSFGSSFLEEAFAGLIRLKTFEKGVVLKHLVVRATKPHLRFFQDEIQDLLSTATPQ